MERGGKNILAKQINSALSPRGGSLRKSDAETEPATGQHQPPLALSIRWSLEVIHYSTDGKHYYHRDEEDRLHSAAVWGSTLTGFCAHIQGEQISNPLSLDTTQHCLSALLYMGCYLLVVYLVESSSRIQSNKSLFTHHMMLYFLWNTDVDIFEESPVYFSTWWQFIVFFEIF